MVAVTGALGANSDEVMDTDVLRLLRFLCNDEAREPARTRELSPSSIGTEVLESLRGVAKARRVQMKKYGCRGILPFDFFLIVLLYPSNEVESFRDTEPFRKPT